ncbi:MAG TPA: primosomal protein N' [Bacteroidetes bacterium]|nr:primosomal protein N' [Bacteroidota bacterium]
MTQTLVDIALPVPLDRTFTYTVPPELTGSVSMGSRVLVPFGKKKLSGIVIGFPKSSTIASLRSILDVLDTEPAFSSEMLQLTRWIGEYYFAPWGEVLKAATPQGLSTSSKVRVRLVAHNVDTLLEETKRTAKIQHAILRALKESGELSLSQVQARAGAKSIRAALNEMERRGWILLEEHLGRTAKPKTENAATLTAAGKAALQSQEPAPAAAKKFTPAQQQVLTELIRTDGPFGVTSLIRKLRISLSAVKSLEKKGLLTIEEREVLRGGDEWTSDQPISITLNPHQDAALAAISEALRINSHVTFLLHGITGSGKTQVYIESIRRALAQGKNAIVLVPEISLTPQTVRRFKSHFGTDVAVMHSQMSIGERYDTWRLARAGKIRIVIGPRSAIFAPLASIGLIVVDEEHESSYKQYDSSPRYHARDVAIVRASMNNAVVILGSATPSAESYYNALNGKYKLLELPERVDDAQLPAIEIVDMARERKERYEEFKKDRKEKGTWTTKLPPMPSISRLLKHQIEERIAKKEGTILLQNRRGFSHVVECFECGYVERCDNCDVTLTYHVTKKHLRCHYCGSVKAAPNVCPKCKGTEIRHHAFGTQQIHEELNTLLPEARVLRMDLDTTTRKGAHDKLLTQFGRGEADILLGTQMVAKGLDFPRVTLVGVISADTQMLLPDFRSSERTFQLLTQVAGRAGRSKLTGEVIIQTLQPAHYSLKHASSHDFAGFYKEELEYRRELDYPPFSRIVLIEFRGASESDVTQHVNKFSEFLMPKAGTWFSVLGPADAAIPKIKNLYRKHLVVKNLKSTDPAGVKMRAALQLTRQQYGASPFGKNRAVQMIIDVDPQGMM